MAKEAQTLIHIPALDKADSKAFLTLTTDKSSSGGLYSLASIEFRSPDSITFELCGDFRRAVQTRHTVRATQKAIADQHSQVFTSDFIAALKAEALAFYAAKAEKTR